MFSPCVPSRSVVSYRITGVALTWPLPRGRPNAGRQPLDDRRRHLARPDDPQARRLAVRGHEVRGPVAVVDRGGHGRLDVARRRLEPERPAQEHRRGQDRARPGWRGPGRRCPARSRGSARTARTVRARSAGPPATPTGSMPRLPASTAASSDRMSPNRFSVTSTSNDAGRRTRSIAHESTSWWSTSTSGYSGAELVDDLAPQARRGEDVRLVDARQAAAAAAGELEGEADDAPDLALRVPAACRCRRGPRACRAAPTAGRSTAPR